jgi:hypothetical protein
MTAFGAISGRVYDSAGEPLVNVPVQALKYAYADGQRTLTVVKTDETDDRGEYRLFWLPPGQYYINAVPQGGGNKVSGIVIDGTTGQPAGEVSITLVPRTASIAGSNSYVPVSEGKFEIKNVLPGSYFLVATARIRHDGGPAVRIMGGRGLVDVSASDVHGVSLVLLPAVDIVGELNLDGMRDTRPDEDYPVITLKNELAGMPAKYGGFDFSDRKHFVVNDVFEGEYRFLVTGLPEGTYVKSIRQGASDVLGGSLRVDPRGNERVEIVLGVNAGSLEGTVFNQNREPVANAPVALVPDAANRHRADLYYSVRSDERGRFQFKSIAPGGYRLFAWEDIEDGLWRDPEFIRRNQASGRPIYINEGSRAAVELTSMPYAF